MQIDDVSVSEEKFSYWIFLFQLHNNDHELDTLTPVRFSGLTQRPNPIAEKIFNVSLILSASDSFIEFVLCIFQTCLDNPFKE